ncbi:MAG: 4a-hydroxytetrahydrobiopterin dehydratase [Pseudomonadota bacterium]
MADILGADAFLKTHPHWQKADDERDAVSRSFKFAEFKTAWAFMSGAALKAEQMDHHPEWSNVYASVDVLLTTHDAGGVTQKDADLAAFMDELAARLAN